MTSNSDLTPEEIHEHAVEVIAVIKPILAHRSSEEVGYILADLLAIWLGGHVVVNEEDHAIDLVETAKRRAELLRLCIETSSLLLHAFHDVSKVSPEETKQ